MPSRFRIRGPLPEIMRSRHIAEVLIRNGLGFVAERTGLSRFVPIWTSRRAPANSQTARLTVPERLRRTIEDLGTTYIKLGQMLSTRPDVLPPAYIAELSKLLDAAPPAPTDEVVAIIEEELGKPLDALYSRFDRESIASASIGQVHRAALADGTDVVVKVQRPGVEQTVRTDLNILLSEARFLEAHSDALRNYNLVAIVQEFSESISAETDYTREGRHADTLRRLTTDEDVLIPRIHWDHTSRRVITMQELDGIKLSETDRLREAGSDLPAVARQLANVYLRHVFVHGVFHADPHPANIMVCGDKIGLIDFGSVGTLSPAMRDQLGDLLEALVRQDADDMVDTVMDMGAFGPGADRDGLRMEIQRLIARYYGAALETVPIVDFFADMLGAALRHGVRLPADLALLVRTLVVLEGVVRGLDPSFDLTALMEPFARKLIMRRPSLRETLLAGSRALRELEELSAALPRRIDALTEQLERGDLTVGLDLRDLPHAMRGLDAIANRLSFSIVVAALVVGSALLIMAGPDVAFRVPSTNVTVPIPELGFLLATVMGAWLLISIIRSRGL